MDGNRCSAWSSTNREDRHAPNVHRVRSGVGSGQPNRSSIERALASVAVSGRSQHTGGRSHWVRRRSGDRVSGRRSDRGQRVRGHGRRWPEDVVHRRPPHRHRRCCGTRPHAATVWRSASRCPSRADAAEPSGSRAARAEGSSERAARERPVDSAARVIRLALHRFLELVWLRHLPAIERPSNISLAP
jgi:hypothetical protein